MPRKEENAPAGVACADIHEDEVLRVAGSGIVPSACPKLRTRLAGTASQGEWQRPKAPKADRLAAIMAEPIFPPSQSLESLLNLGELVALVVHQGDVDLLLQALGGPVPQVGGSAMRVCKRS